METYRIYVEVWGNQGKLEGIRFVYKCQRKSGSSEKYKLNQESIREIAFILKKSANNMLIC